LIVSAASIEVVGETEGDSCWLEGLTIRCFPRRDCHLVGYR